MPIEIFIDHDLSELEVVKMFEDLKMKIGEPSTYELSEAEKEEIENIKQRIIEMENAERAAEERIIAEKEREEKERQAEEWVCSKFSIISNLIIF